MRTHNTTKQILYCFLTLIVGGLIHADTTSPLIPLKADTPPLIDGKLDEPLWQQAPQVTGFKTWTPDFGQLMSETTVVYYAYDSRNLYFAFRCFDRQPQQIKTSITSRDNIRREDWVCINLDSFYDQQSLFAFYANPSGIQEDSVYSGGREDLSVDLVWYSAGHIDEQGYTVEIRIPFKSIRFNETNPVKMGVIFERRISRRSEQGTCPPLSPDQGLAFLTQMRPILYHDVKPGTLLEILPAFTYSRRYAASEGDLGLEESKPDLSLTAKYGITANLVVDATVNPDFSQVEADAGQVDANLRYSLYYPEKRPFFLEGSEYFNFGASSSEDPLGYVVYTRQIIDPIAGIRLTGKLGKKNTLALIYARDEVPEEENAHFSILRYKRALRQDGYLGIFYTGRDTKGRFNRVAGIDGQVRLGRASLLGFHAFASGSKDSPESQRQDGHACGVNYTLSRRKLDFIIGALDISPHFRTDTGYLTRSGISRVYGILNPKIYPRGKILRRIDVGGYASWTRDRFDHLDETLQKLYVDFTLTKNSYISFSYTRADEVFRAQKFDIGGLDMVVASQILKQVFFRLAYWRGKAIRYIEDPYQGRGSQASALLILQPSNKVRSELRLTYADLYRESDSEKIFDYTIIRSKNTLQLNRYLFLRAIVEYNTYKKEMLTDFLVSFTYIPGTVVHLGYGSLYDKVRWENDRYVESHRFLETKRGIFFKVSYLWRL
jgi:hypothetical protein